MIKSTIRIQVRDHIASLDYDPLNNLILVGSDGRSAFGKSHAHGQTFY
jgi:hypothetical protein